MPTGPHPTPPDVRAPAATTAALAAAGGAAMVSLAVTAASPLALVLATAGVLLAVYEWIAITSDEIPTVTEILKGNGAIVRALAIAIPVLAWIDHIGPGWIF